MKQEKKVKIDALRKRLLSGADFAMLARESSDCPSKDKGGDPGMFPRGQMVKPFEDTAFSQRVNAIGPVVETQFGYHIIQVLEHTQARAKTLENVRPEIIKSLQAANKQKATKQYIDHLISKATIVYGNQ